MKSLFGYFLIFNLTFITSTSCQKLPDVTDSANVPVIKWEHNSYDFGELAEGARVVHEYKFKNTGNIPLIISNVLVTCGCTVPEWPKTPVLPKKTGVIRIFFNTKGKTGMHHKTVTILTNSKTGRETVMFSAKILPRK